MAIDINDVIEGLDPSVLAEISGSQLLQMVRNLEPSGSRGLVICEDATPDVGTYPKFSRYMWIRPSEDNKIIRTWNPTLNTWEGPEPQNNTIGTDKIQDEAITLPKLYNPNDITKQYYLLRVNAAGTGFELWQLDFANGSISIEKITKGANNTFPHVKSDGSVWEFLTADDISALFSDGVLNIGKLTAGTPGAIPIQNSAGTKLAALNPGIEGYVLSIVGGLPGYKELPGYVLTSKHISALITLPALVGTIIEPHGLGDVPSIVDVKLVCIAGDGDYVANDEVPISSFYFESGAGIQYPISVSSDTTNIRVSFSSNGIGVLRKDGMTILTIDRAKWNVKIVALK